MKRVIFMGDLHVSSRTPLSRIDDYGSTVLNKLNTLLKLAIDNKVDTIICTGDFFDAYHEPISYMNRLIEVLNNFVDNNIEFLSLIGNHDLPYNNMDYFHTTPLSLLFKSKLVKPLDKIETSDTIIYGLHFTEMNLLKDIKELMDHKKTNILVMHYATDNTVPYESVDQKELEDFDIVVSGHDHMFYDHIVDNGLNILRPGSFTRMTKDSYNLNRDIIVYLYDLESKVIDELKLPNVSPADKVFKNKVFVEGTLDLYKNDLNSIFREDSFNYDKYDINKILESLPPTVSKESKSEVISFLKNKGWLADE